MRILVDGDACPVKNIIEEEASKKSIPVIMYFDDAHVYNSEYSKVVIVPRGNDSVDYKIMIDAVKNDLIITNDYGLASLVLSKGVKVLTPSGMIINEINLDSLLFSRAMSKKMRNSGVRLKGPKKRTKEDDLKFREKLTEVIYE